jgi:hypothetical protein
MLKMRNTKKRLKKLNKKNLLSTVRLSHQSSLRRSLLFKKKPRKKRKFSLLMKCLTLLKKKMLKSLKNLVSLLIVVNSQLTVEHQIFLKRNLSRLILRKERHTIIAHAVNRRISHSVMDRMREQNSSHFNSFLRVMLMIPKRYRKNLSVGANTIR